MILEVIVGASCLVAGALIGRRNNKPQEPSKRRLCDHKWSEGKGLKANSYTCTAVSNPACINAYCSKHCKEARCGCMEDCK